MINNNINKEKKRNLNHSNPIDFNLGIHPYNKWNITFSNYTLNDYYWTNCFRFFRFLRRAITSKVESSNKHRI